MITMTFRLPMTAAMVCIVIVFFCGCSDTAREPRTPETDGKISLTVEFPSDVPLRYRVLTSRDIVLDFDPSGKVSRPGSSSKQEMKEEAEFILSYKAIGRADRGGTLVEVTCENASVKRQRLSSGSSPSDALASLSGKTFRIKLSATGQMFDTTELDKVIYEMGEAAFGGRGDKYEGRRIKNPDMIADFIAVQWYMWDQQQSIARPAAGVATGQEWPSKRKLLAPMPFVARTGRSAKYTLAEVTQTDEGTRAIINSTYGLADGPSMDWPIPYTGNFSQRGSFGFFRGYNVLELSGRGTQIFDVTGGKIVSDRQDYTAKISAIIPFGGLGKDGTQHNRHADDKDGTSAR
jgi:hypothetical protein